MRIFFTAVVIIGIVLSVTLVASCNGTEAEENGISIQVTEKASSNLIAQITLRNEQIEDPKPERLELMKNMGMQVVDLGMQKVFIHLEERPDTSRVSELEALGLTVHPDTWIPPVGVHTTGFLIADMPVGSLDALAAKDYVIKLDTAEQKVEVEPDDMKNDELRQAE